MVPVHVVHVLEATEGGTRKWLENVVLGLDPARVRNSCICSVARGHSFLEAVDSFRRHGVDVHLVKMQRQINILKDARAVVEVARLLHNKRYDVIHAHSSKAGIVARLAACLTNTGPVVYTPHAFSFLMPVPMRHLYKAAEKLARFRTDCLMAVSPSEGQLARELGYDADKITVVCNGVNISPSGQHEGALPPVVGFVGGLRAQKDPMTFLAACAIVHSAKPNVRFMLCGTGPMLNACEAFVKEAGLDGVITLTGWTADVPLILRSLSIFVSCSRYEGFSYALLEAMAASKPIVATDVPGNRDAITDEVTGVLVPLRDAHALANGILRLLQDPPLANSLGQCARERALTCFSLKDQLGQLADFYEIMCRYRPHTC